MGFKSHTNNHTFLFILETVHIKQKTITSVWEMSLKNTIIWGKFLKGGGLKK